MTDGAWVENKTTQRTANELCSTSYVESNLRSSLKSASTGQLKVCKSM
jgi:hypothetical protein